MPQAQDTIEAVQAALQADLSCTAVAANPHPLHGIHPYAARFPYGLADHFIRALTQPGDTVLDPTCGSGVTLLEAGLAGRRSIGVDIDPLAVKQSNARAQHIDPCALLQAGHRIWVDAGELVDHANPWLAYSQGLDRATKDFIENWYPEYNLDPLAALAIALRSVKEPPLRNALEVALSASIIANAGGVSNAVDLAHSRPHRVPGRNVPKPLGRFLERVERIAAAHSVTPCVTDGYAISADARQSALPDAAFDLALTSPPYAGALDYMRSHKFTLVWTGYSIPSARQLGAKYIGSGGKLADNELPAYQKAGQVAVEELKQAGHHADAKRIAKYCVDLDATIRETAKLLKPGAAAVYVVAASTVRGVTVSIPDIVDESQRAAGLIPCGVAERKLDRNRRMLPMRNTPGDGIENRMRTECVVVAVKPD